jgi:ribonuclease P protein component
MRKRAEFQRVRGGGRSSTASFVLEGKARVASGAPSSREAVPAGSRFGFTISRKVGNAVVRNRIRRRLKAALAELIESCADPGFDYVVVARTAAAEQAFPQLKLDLEAAFRRVHAIRRPSSRGNPPSIGNISA